MSPTDFSLDRGLSASPEAERSILGFILLENNMQNKALSNLKLAHFSLNANRRIFQRMADLSEASRPIDIINLAAELQRYKELDTVGGFTYLASLTDTGKISEHWPWPESKPKHYSCFISYTEKDREFANRLHADLQASGVDCWFAPHNVKSGKKLREQVDQAIRLYERLLLILSRSSIESEWVKTEIKKARNREIADKRRVLFPVRLISFEALKEWEYPDGDNGGDIAREIREYYIPDFTKWKEDPDNYQREFKRLVESLKLKVEERAEPMNAEKAKAR